MLTLTSDSEAMRTNALTPEFNLAFYCLPDLCRSAHGGILAQIGRCAVTHCSVALQALVDRLGLQELTNRQRHRKRGNDSFIAGLKLRYDALSWLESLHVAIKAVLRRDLRQILDARQLLLPWKVIAGLFFG